MRYFSFQWHITDACDQRCEHCYIYSAPNVTDLHEVTFSNMEIILKNCIDMCNQLNRKPYFSITGGDPILHKSFWDLLELLKSFDIPFNILGNPFHLNRAVCERLHSLGCQKYQLSLDGLENTHDKIRRKGSYKATLEKIPVIRDSGILCAIMTTVSSTNIHEIPKLIDIVVENNVDVYAFARYCPVKSETDLLVSAQDYRDLLEQCWEKFSEHKDAGTSFNLKDHLWTLYLYEKGLFTIRDDLDSNTIYEGCNCAINHMTILSDATIYACRRMTSPVGNAINDSLLDVFCGASMAKYRQYYKFEKCSKCELLRFCRGCPATTFGINGNMYAPDPQCWKTIE